MATGMTKERRVAPRITERVTLALQGPQAAVEAESRNLSASGVYCFSKQLIAPMTKLALDFTLPQGGKSARIQCTGVVVRVEPLIANAVTTGYHLAIFFSDLSERQRATIQQFVRQRLSAS
jgi:hypothetical protein